MKPFKEWLNEVFNRDYGKLVSMEKPEFTPDNCRFEFYVGPIRYSMDISLVEESYIRKYDRKESDLNIWEVAFSAGPRGDSSVEITGSGNSMMVFQAVMDCMKIFYKHYENQIHGISFSAHEISRRILYLKLAQRFAPQYYMTIIKTPVGHEKDGGFIMVKNNLLALYDFTDLKAVNTNHFKQLRLKSNPSLT